MPSSYHGHISEVLDLYIKANPKTVLDIGVGFGKWGTLFREYGDVFRGRPFRKDWEIEITGVEAFDDYQTPIYSYVYSKLFFLPIEDFVDKFDYKYDFIYAGDVIEHLEKDEAKRVIKILQERSKHLVITIPLGDRWPQEEIFGNKYEVHKSTWTENELLGFFLHSTVYMNSAGKPIGVFYDSK